MLSPLAITQKITYEALPPPQLIHVDYETELHSLNAKESL